MKRFAVGLLAGLLALGGARGQDEVSAETLGKVIGAALRSLDEHGGALIFRGLEFFAGRRVDPAAPPPEGLRIGFDDDEVMYVDPAGTRPHLVPYEGPGGQHVYVLDGWNQLDVASRRIVPGDLAPLLGELARQITAGGPVLVIRTDRVGEAAKFGGREFFRLDETGRQRTGGINDLTTCRMLGADWFSLAKPSPPHAPPVIAPGDELGAWLTASWHFPQRRPAQVTIAQAAATPAEGVPSEVVWRFDEDPERTITTRCVVMDNLATPALFRGNGGQAYWDDVHRLSGEFTAGLRTEDPAEPQRRDELRVARLVTDTPDRQRFMVTLTLRTPGLRELRLSGLVTVGSGFVAELELPRLDSPLLAGRPLFWAAEDRRQVLLIEPRAR